MNRRYTDQLFREVEVPFPPSRIVSLVPSLTELLFDLGLDKEIAGVTKFCVHPEDKVAGKVRVGGTKILHAELIADLSPDLVLANREENEKAAVEALSKHFPVWVSDVASPEDALEMILAIGEMTGKADRAVELTRRIQEGFEKLVPLRNPLRAAYLIWRKPWMAAGGGTFIHSMMSHCGFINVFGNRKRYPSVRPEELSAANPHVVLLSSEPYPFSGKHLPGVKDICPFARTELVDGEMFSWYGSRMLHAPGYFSGLVKKLS